MSIGRQIKLLRKELGLSQEKLAEALNLSKSAISMYECENRQPNYLTLCTIANYFNVTVDALLGEERFNILPADSFNFDLTYEEQNIIKQYRNKPELQQAIKLLFEVK